MSTPVTAADISAALNLGPADLYDAFRRRFEPGASPEDPPLDSALLASAARVFADAASAAQADQRADDQARALIGLASVRAAANSLPALQEAERALLEALRIVHTQTDGPLAIHAYLLLLDLLVKIVDAVKADDRAGFIERALGFARAAEYVAARVGDEHARARFAAHESALLAERFRGDRDQNLMDAVAAGERALALAAPDRLRVEIRWPLLLLHMGSASVKIAPERNAWLQRGEGYYERGGELVDVSRYPGLARVLGGNLAVYRGQSEEERRQLPPKEMYPRLRIRVEEAAAAGDRDAAFAAASEMMTWASAIPEQPNPFVGHAHVMLGQLYIAVQQWSDARQQLEAGLAVLKTVFSPNDSGYGYVRSAMTLYERAAAGERGEAT